MQCALSEIFNIVEASTGGFDLDLGLKNLPLKPLLHTALYEVVGKPEEWVCPYRIVGTGLESDR